MVNIFKSANTSDEKYQMIIFLFTEPEPGIYARLSALHSTIINSFTHLDCQFNTTEKNG